jgi:DNA-binding NarL/FixJ family response regulator
VDDHPLVREWLANVINQQWDLTVCGESEGRENCIEAIQKKKPDVAIVDISLRLVRSRVLSVSVSRQYRSIAATFAKSSGFPVLRNCIPSLCVGTNGTKEIRNNDGE